MLAKPSSPKYVTNTDGTVYGFTGALSPVSIAAAMRSPQPARRRHAHYFARRIHRQSRQRRSATAACYYRYGDDSVQQLTGQYIVVEQASNLLTKKAGVGPSGPPTWSSQPATFTTTKRTPRVATVTTCPPALKGKLRAQYIDTMTRFLVFILGWWPT